MISSAKFNLVALTHEYSNTLGDFEGVVPFIGKATVNEIIIDRGGIGMLDLALLATPIEIAQEGSYSNTPLVWTVTACIDRVDFDVGFVTIDECLVIVRLRCYAIVIAWASRPFHLVVDEPDSCLMIVVHVLTEE